MSGAAEPKIEVMVRMSGDPWSYFVIDCGGRTCTVKVDINKWYVDERTCFDNKISEDEITILNYELHMASTGVREDMLFTVYDGKWYDVIIPTRLYKVGISTDGDNWKLDCVANYIKGMIEKKLGK